MKRRKNNAGALMRIILAVLLALMLAMPAGAQSQWGDLNARYARVPQLDYNGARYRLKTRLTTILLAGIDHAAQDAPLSMDHRNGGQADFLLLLAMDDAAKTITPIQIDRDTMTEITILNVLGEVSGARNAQICLSHSFGDGAQYSCELMASAVETLLMGTPVKHYFALNMDGIAAFNDAIGGVEVTLRDDFSFFDPEMTAGKTMVLRGEQAHAFVRQRLAMDNKTNAARQLRQQDYLQSAQRVLAERLKKNNRFILELRSLLDAYAVTDMADGRLLNYTKAALDYEVLPIQTLPGAHSVGETGYVEFHVDEDALLELVVSTFFQPMK